LPDKAEAPRARRDPHAVRISLLIPTHALPPLSYSVPERLRDKVRVGTAVVAPLSGHLRLGIVVATGVGDGNAREYLRDVVAGLSLPPDLVELCGWVSEAAAVPLPVVLRTALPPGLNTGRYRVLESAPGWPWESGDLVVRAALKRTLGPKGLRKAEADGRITLAPAATERATVEWAMMARDETFPDLGRAPRQRRLLELLKEHGYACTTSILLSEAGAARSTLRELVRKGAVRLAQRPEPAPLFATSGGETGDPGPFLRRAEPAVRRGGAFVWRIPTAEYPDAVAALTRATVEGGEQALVLVAEIEAAEHLVRRLRRALPAGLTVAPYHSGLGRDRAAVYEAVRAGKLDVLVGTRTAALLPLARLGTICVVDEPNEAHRAEPGYEGLPIHVRDVALERGRIEGTGVFCLSPFPSLRLFAREQIGIRELPARRPESWPVVRIVDMRGSGAALSSTLFEACRRVPAGGRVGVVANRLGYAAAVTCNGCGTVRSCPDCGSPLVLHERTGLLVCNRCGHRGKVKGRCGVCGSDRASPIGLAVERTREEISGRLDGPVGLITAGERELVDAPVVVGTARCILDERWHAVILPDADSSLMGTGIAAVERAFRLFYRAAEAARELLLIQTRLPEHYALREAVRGDYPAFAAAELPRLRALSYPPFGHLASVTLEGPRETIQRAVESRLRPALEPAVEISGPVPLTHTGEPPRWRVLLRSGDRPVVARAATLAARLSTETRGLRVRVDVDPEEV